MKIDEPMSSLLEPTSPPPAGTAVLPDRPPVPSRLDPTAALAFRTPMQEHVASADGKAAGVLTLLGLMFTILTRLGTALGELLSAGGPFKWLALTLLVGFASAAAATVIQAFRTIAPRFPKVEPSLAFFGDIARMTREEYVRRVTALSADEAIGHMLSYNHTTATILAGKQRQLQLGLQLFKLATVCWLPLAVVLVVRAL